MRLAKEGKRGSQRPIPIQEAILSTALIQLALSPSRETADDIAHIRPRADFLAQLIATAAQAPQTRPRRRAEPQQAADAYRAQEPRPAPAGRALSRAL